MLDVFIRVYRKNWKLALQYLVSLVISSTSTMMLPKAIESIQKIPTLADQSELFPTLSFWTFLFLIGSIASYYRKTGVEKLDLYITLSIKRRFFKSLLSKNMQFYNSAHSGRLSQILNRDVKDFCSILTIEFSSILRGGVFCVISTILLLFTNATLLAVAALPLFFLIYAGKKIAAYLRSQRFYIASLNQKLNAYTSEVFRQIKTVKLFSAESLELEKFSAFQQEINSKTFEFSKYANGFFVIVGLAVQVIVMCGLGFGVYLRQFWPDLKIEDYSTTGIYVAYAGFGFTLMLSGYSEIQKAFGLFDGISKVYEDGLKEDFADEKWEKSEKLPSIEFRELRFKYAGMNEEAIRGVSLMVKPGEIVGIVGASGNGKTTLFNLMTCLYRPSAGDVLIEGESVFDKRPHWARGQYGIVTQEGLLFTGTILDNLQYTTTVKDFSEIQKICKKIGLTELIDSLPDKFQTKVGENGLSLSGGQRQRICIARALLKKPKILLLDEATCGLDSAAESKIQSLLDSTVKSRKYTVLIITHRVSSLQTLADQIFYISNGQIKAQGTYQSLLQNPDFVSLTNF